MCTVIYHDSAVRIGTDDGPVPINPLEPVAIVTSLGRSHADEAKIPWQDADGLYGLGLEGLGMATGHEDHPSSATLTGSVRTALIGLFIGVIPATMVEAFPARVRCSAVATGYNVCLGLIGGTTPMVVTYLLAWSHDALAPAYYLMGAAAVSLGALLGWRETAKMPLP